MALKRQHKGFGTIRQMVTDRLFLQMLPITDPEEFGEELDEAARKSWQEHLADIPKVTGDLREILTSKDHANREIRVRSGEIVILVKHNGMAYRVSVREAVREALDVRKVIREAVDSLRRKASRTTLRGRRRR